MYPVGGKSFRPVEERGRAVQALGERVVDADSRGGQATGEELEDFHAMAAGWGLERWLGCDGIVIAYARPARVFRASGLLSGADSR